MTEYGTQRAPGAEPERPTPTDTYGNTIERYPSIMNRCVSRSRTLKHPFKGEVAFKPEVAVLVALTDSGPVYYLGKRGELRVPDEIYFEDPTARSTLPGDDHFYFGDDSSEILFGFGGASVGINNANRLSIAEHGLSVAEGIIDFNPIQIRDHYRDTTPVQINRYLESQTTP